MAETAVYRERLRDDATGYNTPERLVGAALLLITEATDHKVSIPKALAASQTDTARDLREVKRDQAMTRKASDILGGWWARRLRRARTVAMSKLIAAVVAMRWFSHSPNARFVVTITEVRS
jgi:hypothetical protein